MVLACEEKSEMSSVGTPSPISSTSSWEDFPPSLSEVDDLPSYEDTSSTLHDSPILDNASYASTNGAPATNYLDITKQFSPITGTWAIDTSLHVPTSMLPPIPANEHRPNIYLKSDVAPIKADVELVGGAYSQRAYVLIKSGVGPITLNLTSPHNQKALIKCSSQAGPIHVFLPRTFRGPVVIKEQIGHSLLSDDLNANLTTFSEVNGERKCFLGQWSGTNFGQNDVEWTGDELQVQSEVGPVSLAYEDEFEEVGRGWCPGGLLGRGGRRGGHRHRGHRHWGRGEHHAFGWPHMHHWHGHFGPHGHPGPHGRPGHHHHHHHPFGGHPPHGFPFQRPFPDAFTWSWAGNFAGQHPASNVAALNVTTP